VINLTGTALAGWATLALQQALWARFSAKGALLAARLRRDRRAG
jgi:hypothetical protein